MDSSPAPPRLAWMPLTPRQVAAFAAAPLWRIGLTQLALALVLALMMVATVRDTWFADVRELIRRLPADAAIRGGELQWTNVTPARISEGRYLAVAVDPERTGALGQEADLTLLLGTTNLFCASVLGYVAVPYPTDYGIALGRADAAAWWGAREVFLAVAIGVGTGVFWLALWWLLASIYWLPAWLLGLFANRDLPPGSAWKLAAAAQLPGLLVFAFALVSYRFGWINLLRLGYGFGLSLGLAWFYLALAPLLTPRAPDRPARENPFAGEPATPPPRGKNPFARS